MLKKITLKNFRRHRELDVDFGAGMTVIRALNEQGKSTLLEAVAYALFGVRALRDSLDDTVTWGEATNTLRVELSLEVEGTEYTVRRGKSGAEVNYPGGSVTGQNEVTNFAAKLLKVDAAAAARLTMSNQNEIRGALEAGTKATTEIIERLAEFGQIDELIELIQAKLPLGSTAAAEAQLEQQEADLAAARANATAPDTASLEADVRSLREASQAAKVALEQAENDAQAASDAFDKGQAAHTQRERLQERLATAQAALKRHHEDLAAAERAAGGVAVFVRTEEQIEAAMADLRDAPRLLAHYQRVKPMLEPVQGLRVQTTLEDVRAEFDSLEVKMGEARAVQNAAATSIARDTALLSSGTCGFCGQDFSELPTVAAKNAELQAAIDTAATRISAAKVVEAECGDRLKALRALRSASSALLQPLPEHVERTDVDLLPPSFKWVGPNIEDLEASKLRLQGLQAELDEMRATRRREALALQRLEDLKARTDEVAGAVGSAQGALDEAPTVDLDDLRAVRTATRDARNEASNAAAQARDALKDAERRVEQLVNAWKVAVQRVEQLEGYVVQRREEIAAMTFNNGLLKKVRSARPVIADKLWNIVLSAVSGYFSEIRGQKSRVSKDGDGFKVDGHPVSSLSGSTKDALGLAIRVALVRTFLPSSPFLILDEPAAAMDDHRTESLLGFISTCGFQQVLLVTHEDVSETLADHIITL